MRQQELGGAPTVVADLVDAAAAEKEKTPHQAAGMMQSPRRRPAIGAAEDRLGTEARTHAREFVGDRRQRLVPRDFAKSIGAGTWGTLAPALADRRAGDSERRMHHCRNSVEHRRWRRVVREGFAGDDAAVLDQRREGTPMRQRGKAGGGHGFRIESSGDLGQDVVRIQAAPASADLLVNAAIPGWGTFPTQVADQSDGAHDSLRKRIWRKLERYRCISIANCCSSADQEEIKFHKSAKPSKSISRCSGFTRVATPSRSR